MSITVTPPPARGPIEVTTPGRTPVLVEAPQPSAPPVITPPPPASPPVVTLPGADLHHAEVPEHAEYPAQTIQERLEQLIDHKADRVFRGQDVFVIEQDGAQVLTLSQRPYPGSLAVYVDGIREFSLDDVPTDGQVFEFPAEWGLYAGARIAFVYDF